MVFLRSIKHSLNMSYVCSCVHEQTVSSKRIIACTTSGAAKYHDLLTHAKCGIVLVEEAAEVLESHVVIRFVKRCDRLLVVE